MGLVDDDGLVLGQNLHALESVNGQQGVIRDDDICLGGTTTRHLAEALLHQRAAAAQTFGRAHRDLSPRAIGHTGLELVAVAGLRAVSPLAQAHDFLAHAGGRRRHVEEGILFLFGVAALELVQAQIVVAALEQGHLRLRLRARLQCLQKTRNIAVHDLRLQGQGRGSHHDGLVGLPHASESRNQVAQRLTGAGAGLHE